MNDIDKSLTDHSDKENDTSDLHKMCVAADGCNPATARTPLSNMHCNSTSSSDPDEVRSPSPTDNNEPRLTVHRPALDLNQSVTVCPPPVVVLHGSTNSCAGQGDAVGPPIDLQNPSSISIHQPLVIEDNCSDSPLILPSEVVDKSPVTFIDEPEVPVETNGCLVETPIRNIDTHRIILDPRFTPITPEDSPLCSKRYKNDDQHKSNIQLNAIILQKVEEMMAHKNKEYSDQLSLRDNTISVLEKEVQKLKDVTAIKSEMPPPNSNKSQGNRTTAIGQTSKNVPKSTNSSISSSNLNRTWSLRISKKDRNEMNDRISAASNIKPKPVNSPRRLAFGTGSTTLPRTLKTDRQSTVNANAQRKNKSEIQKTDSVSNKVAIKSKLSAKSAVKKQPDAKSASSMNASTSSSKSVSLDNSNDSTSAVLNTSIESSDSKPSAPSPDPDFVAHLKRLTEEHEKLQIEYARLRVQVVESGSATSPSNETTASIENSNQQTDFEVENKKLNSIICGYKQETSRLQEELRRVQRKYWEQKLGSESIETELQCASKQVVDLIDKLDDATCELTAEKRKSAEIASHLSVHAKRNTQMTLELEEAHDKICQLEQQLAQIVNDRRKLSSSIKDMECEGKETQEFLMAERNAATESLQEAESELKNCRAEMSKYHMMLAERNDQCYKLTDKLEQKDLYVQMLRAELDSSQSRARDMLLSQGAQMTSASLALSEVGHRIKSVIKSSVIANNLNEQVINKLLESNGIDKQDLKNGNCVNNQQQQQPQSPLIQSVLKAIEEVHLNDDQSNDQSNLNQQRQTVKSEPVCLSSPFHCKPGLKPILEEETLSDSNKSDAENDGQSRDGNDENDVINQINAINMLLTKFAIITGMVQDKLNNQIEQLQADKKVLEGKLAKEQSDKSASHTNLTNQISRMQVEMSELRRQEALLNTTKNKLTTLCEGHEKTIKNLNKDIQEMRMKNGCIEAEIKEKRQQLTAALDKMSALVSSSDHSYPGIQYVPVSEALSEKFGLKSEIARLQGQVSENEKLLDEMASKFTRNKTVLEDNWQKAEAEVQRLDDVIDSVLHVLHQIPDTVESCKLLSQLYTELTSSNAENVSNCHNTSAINEDQIQAK